MEEQEQQNAPPVAEVVVIDDEAESGPLSQSIYFGTQVVIPYFKYEDHVDEFPDLIPATDPRTDNPRRREPLARRDRMVNILSQQGVDDVMNQMLQTGMLVHRQIRTGHTPSCKTGLVSRFKITSGYAQVTPRIGGIARKELDAWWESYTKRYNEASPEQKQEMTEPVDHKRPKQLQVSHVVWRASHNYRQLCVGLEASHRGAAYDGFDFGPHPLDERDALKGSEFESGGGVPGKTNWLVQSSKGPLAANKRPFENFQPLPGHRVEEVELESEDVQETRKYCATTYAMWRKGSDGSLIGEDEVFTGQTMCPHQLYGKICFGPYPVSRQDQERLAQAAGSRPRKRNVKSSAEQSAKRQKGMPTGGSQTPQSVAPVS